MYSLDFMKTDERDAMKLKSYSGLTVMQGWMWVAKIWKYTLGNLKKKKKIEKCVSWMKNYYAARWVGSGARLDVGRQTTITATAAPTYEMHHNMGEEI